MKPLRLKKRLKRWINGCKRHNVQYIRSSILYKKYITGKKTYSEAFNGYLKACKRHEQTNYDDLWINSQVEREQKAQYMVDNFNIEFDQAMRHVNKAYKPMLKQTAMILAN